jgi:putative peptidoglycan lipid II flippase
MTSTESQGGKSSGRVARAAVVVGGFTLLSRIFALGRDLAISHIFGATRLTDVFFLAFTIPNVLRRLVGEGGVTVAFVPVYARVRESQGEDEAKRFLAATFGLAAVGVLVLTVLGIVGAPALVTLFASGFRAEPETFQLAVDLTRWLFPYVYCISLVAVAMGALNAHGHFAAPAAAPALLNVSIVVATLFFQHLFDPPIYVLVGGVLVGGVLQLLLQIPALMRTGIFVLPRLSLDENVRDLLRTGAPALFGLAVYQLNIVILRQLASYLPEGHMTYYYNADRLTQFAFGVFGVAIATAALPTMSEQAAKGDHKAMLSTWRFSTSLTNFVTIPSALGLGAIALPIVAVLYRHGAFTWDDTTRTAWATVAFAPWLVATAAVRSTVQAFYALKDLRTPVIVGGVTVVLTLGFGLGLLRYEVVGLCVALSAASWVQLIVLVVWLRLRVGPLGLREIAKGAAAQTALACAAVAPAWAIGFYGSDWKDGFSLVNAGLLGAAIFVAALVYGGGAMLFGFKEGNAVREKLGRRFRKRR